MQFVGSVCIKNNSIGCCHDYPRPCILAPIENVDFWVTFLRHSCFRVYVLLKTGSDVIATLTTIRSPFMACYIKEIEIENKNGAASTYLTGCDPVFYWHSICNYYFVSRAFCKKSFYMDRPEMTPSRSWLSSGKKDGFWKTLVDFVRCSAVLCCSNYFRVVLIDTKIAHTRRSF